MLIIPEFPCRTREEDQAALLTFDATSVIDCNKVRSRLLYLDSLLSTEGDFVSISRETDIANELVVIIGSRLTIVDPYGLCFPKPLQRIELKYRMIRQLELDLKRSDLGIQRILVLVQITTIRAYC